MKIKEETDHRPSHFNLLKSNYNNSSFPELPIKFSGSSVQTQPGPNTHTFSMSAERLSFTHWDMQIEPNKEACSGPQGRF